MEKILAVVMALFALPLLIGGIYLLTLGGSPYYIFAGAVILLTAILLFMRRKAAYALYAVFTIITIIWAVWEAGFYW